MWVSNSKNRAALAVWWARRAPLNSLQTCTPAAPAASRPAGQSAPLGSGVRGGQEEAEPRPVRQLDGVQGSAPDPRPPTRSGHRLSVEMEVPTRPDAPPPTPEMPRPCGRQECGRGRSAPRRPGPSRQEDSSGHLDLNGARRGQGPGPPRPGKSAVCFSHHPHDSVSKTALILSKQSPCPHRRAAPGWSESRVPSPSRSPSSLPRR